jgi:alkaline phosphatase D
MSRRRFLGRSLMAAGGLALGRRASSGAAPAIVRLGEPPQASHGVASGDVTAGRGIVWSRCDRPARMVVEWDTTDGFRNPRRVEGPAALPETGLTARVDLTGLPPDQRIFYRVRFQDLEDTKLWSEPALGSFASAPEQRRGVRFLWSADTAGQGWGIDESRGGMCLYETMRVTRPDFFVHCGDWIYADNPLQKEVPLPDGGIWRNIVTPAKSKVAETLDEFRGNYLYNLLDANLRRFGAEVPQLGIWDDHEVLNNWYPGELLQDERYQERRVSVLAERARQAFLEHVPLRFSAQDPLRVYRSYVYGPSLELFLLDLRSYRGPNGPNRQEKLGPGAAILGREQLDWLKRGLVESRATWKVIASDMPIGLQVAEWPSETDFEGIANGDGPPLGRELEIADLLRALRDADVRNTIWLTADVHYCAAHHYHPDRARFREFLPFWEFVAGPLHAGTFGPSRLDETFGPEVRFLGIPEGMAPNRPPSEGLQFFGQAELHPDSETLSVSLHDLSGRTLWSVDLEPEGRG